MHWRKPAANYSVAVFGSNTETCDPVAQVYAMVDGSFRYSCGIEGFFGETQVGAGCSMEDAEAKALEKLKHVISKKMQPYADVLNEIDEYSQQEG